MGSHNKDLRPVKTLHFCELFKKESSVQDVVLKESLAPVCCTLLNTIVSTFAVKSEY